MFKRDAESASLCTETCKQLVLPLVHCVSDVLIKMAPLFEQCDVHHCWDCGLQTQLCHSEVPCVMNHRSKQPSFFLEIQSFSIVFFFSSDLLTTVYHRMMSPGMTSMISHVGLILPLPQQFVNVENLKPEE